MCNTQLKEKIVEHKEFSISLGKFKAMVCPNCGEIFYDSEAAEKIQKRSKGLGLFGLASKKTKVASPADVNALP